MQSFEQLSNYKPLIGGFQGPPPEIFYNYKVILGISSHI